MSPLMQEGLAVVDAHVRVVEIRMARADALDLGAAQFDPRLEPIQDVIFPEDLAVVDDVLGHKSPSTVGGRAEAFLLVFRERYPGHGT